jgi:hypothetical protein
MELQDAPRASRELLDRLTDDLTALIRSPEGRWSKRNLNAFVDALKRVDYVVLGGNDAEAGASLEEQVAAQA